MTLCGRVPVIKVYTGTEVQVRYYGKKTVKTKHGNRISTEKTIMDNEKPRKFHYIDAMPGAGKTKYFVDQATRMLCDGPRDRGSKILVYVAPTVDLLAETYKRIQVESKRSRLMEDRVYVIAGREGLTRAFGAVTHRDCQDQPTNALNFLFGLISEQDYRLVRYKKGYLHSLQEALRPGDIVMTTHESFVRVSRHDTTGRGFEILRQTAVVFDEARQCVLKPYPYSMERDQWRQVFQCVDVRTASSNSTKREKKEIAVFRIDGIVPLAEAKKTFGVTAMKDLPEAIRSLRRKFKAEVENGRGSLYIITTATLADTFDAGPRKNRIFIQVVMRPSALFTNYRQVVLTSAFFTDSQMYHFLKADGHQLINLLDQRKLSPALEAIKARSAQLRTSAAKRLHVATLLLPTRGGFYRENLTSNLLDSGMVLPRQVAVSAYGHVRPDLSVDEVIAALSARRMSVSVTNQKNLDDTLRKYAVPPLWVLLLCSVQIFRAWTEKYMKAGSNPYSLLALNVNPKRTWVTGVRYIHVVRTIADNGKLSTRSVTGTGEYNADHARDVNLVSDRWVKRLRSTLYKGNPDSAFTLTASTQLHGINTYSKMNAFTHLAALNPSPLQVRIYNVLIPKYDVDQDHSIENLVQTLYRTSLRDPDATDPVLMIVPYASSANLLAEKVGVDRFKVVSDSKLVAFTHSRAHSEESEDQRIKKVQGASRKYDPKFNKDIEAARQRLKAARSRLQRSPESAAVQATVKSHEAVLEKLKTRAASALKSKQ